MTGSRDTLPAPELPAENRRALVVATATYSDPALRQLRSPAQDAAGLGDTLADPRIGGFDVKSVMDGTAHDLRMALEDFLAESDTGDLLLVYLSCHGLLDARGRLHFTASDTLKSRLAATGIESRWLLEQLEDCRTRRQVLILDCCFSGAFHRGVKGPRDIDLGQQLGGHSRGRVVLTASRANEYSFEGEPVAGAMTGSVFTAALLEGLRTGEADINNDGYISVDEAYDYAFTRARAGGATQTPQRWVYGAEGDSIVLARSVAGITIGAAPLPEALRAGLDNPVPEIRLGVVHALQRWLHGPDPAKMLAARQALHRIADTDVPAVAAAARDLLERQRTPPSVPAVQRRPRPRTLASPVAVHASASLELPTGTGSGPPDTDGPSPLALGIGLPGIDPDELAGLSASPHTGPRRILPREQQPTMFVARYFFPNERFRGEWRRHPIFLVKRAALGGSAAAIGFLGIPLLPSYVDSPVVDALPADIRYWVAGGLLAWTVWSLVTWRWYRFVLTNRRLMVVSGLIIRRIGMMPLIRLTDMKYSQSWLARLLDYGTYRLESAGRIDRMRKLCNVPSPNEIYLRIVEEMYEPATVEARITWHHGLSEDPEDPQV